VRKWMPALRYRPLYETDFFLKFVSIYPSHEGDIRTTTVIRSWFKTQISADLVSMVKMPQNQAGHGTYISDPVISEVAQVAEGDYHPVICF
jgi:hypothetical protein